MGPMKRKGFDSGWVCKKEEVDDRLNRRLKRRSISNRNFKRYPIESKNNVGQYCKSPSNNNSAPINNYVTIDDDDDDDDEFDVDYKTFLDSLSSRMFPYVYDTDDLDVAVNDQNVDAKCVHDANVTARSVDDYTPNLRMRRIDNDSNGDGSYKDDDIIYGLLDNGIVGDNVVDDGNYVDYGSVDYQTTNVSIRKTVNDDHGDASYKDNDIIYGPLDHGIVADRDVDYGNNVDAMPVDAAGGDDDNHNNHNSDDCGLIDPHYKAFLENLKEDGKAYILEISISNAVSMLIKYEADDGPCNWYNVEDPDMMRDCTVRENMNTKKHFNRCSSTERLETQKKMERERMETQRKLGSVPSRERKSSVLERNVKKEAVDAVSGRAYVHAMPRAAALGSRKETMGTQKNVSEALARNVKKESEDPPISCRAIGNARPCAAAVDPISSRDNGHAGLSAKACGSRRGTLETEKQVRETLERNVEKNAVGSISCRGNEHARPSAAALASRRDTMETQKKMRDVPARERMSSLVGTKPKKKPMDHISCKAYGHARHSAAALGSRGETMETQRNVRHVAVRERMSSVMELLPKKEAGDPISCKDNGRGRPSAAALALRRERKESQREVRDGPPRERMSSVVETKQKRKAMDLIFCRANGHARKRALGSTSSKHKCQVKLDMKDREYLTYLNSPKNDTRHAAFMPKSSKSVIYEKDEQSSSDSEAIIIDTSQFGDGDCTPFVTSKSYLGEDGRDFSVGKKESSLHREMLIQILQKPYDQREYEELLEKAYHAGPVTRNRDLRNKTVTYTTNVDGKSYIDLYCDLAKEIHAAGCDQPKILNLLRGFFYWLENLPHGVFKPWLDSMCLEVRPPHK